MAEPHYASEDWPGSCRGHRSVLPTNLRVRGMSALCSAGHAHCAGFGRGL